MADFLTRLAERTVRADDAARPLIAPIFAAGPALVGDEAGRLRAEEESRAEAVGPPAPAELSTEQMLEAFSRSAARLLLPLADRAGEPPPGARHQDERDQPERPRDQPRDQASTPDETRAGEPAFTRQSLRPELHRVEAPARARQAGEIAQALRDAGEGLIKELKHESDSGEAEQTARAPRRAALPVVVQPPQADAAARVVEQADPWPGAGESSAPAIEVTIGRIEVRAVTAAKPSAPRRAAARGVQPLSLSEYLKQRDEGKR